LEAKNYAKQKLFSELLNVAFISFPSSLYRRHQFISVLILLLF